jgi:hypothetical protein
MLLFNFFRIITQLFAVFLIQKIACQMRREAGNKRSYQRLRRFLQAARTPPPFFSRRRNSKSRLQNQSPARPLFVNCRPVKLLGDVAKELKTLLPINFLIELGIVFGYIQFLYYGVVQGAVFAHQRNIIDSSVLYIQSIRLYLSVK